MGLRFFEAAFSDEYSREHLPKYADEFAFRWNTRKDTDGKRMVKAIALTEWKRLTYWQTASISADGRQVA